MKLRMPFLEHRFRARALTAPGHDLLWPAQTRDQQKFGIFDSVVSGRPAPSPRRRASQDMRVKFSKDIRLPLNTRRREFVAGK